MTTPAGWYDDGSGSRRWWDGVQWTQHVVRGDQPPATEAVATEAVATDSVATDPTAPATVSDEPASGSDSEPFIAPPSEPAAFAPPYMMPSHFPTAPADSAEHGAVTHPAVGGGPGASWPVAPASAAPPASGVPVVGLIGLFVVVVGIVGVCIPMIAIVGWGLLAAGFVLSLVSLFLRGRKWPGITGLALAVIGAILAVAVSFIVLATTSITQSEGGPLPYPSERPPADDGSTTQGEDPSAIEGAEMVPFAELEVGDCLPFVDYGDQEEIFDLPVVSCDQPHTDEVYFIYELEDGEFPGDDALGETAWNGCVAEFEAYVGIPYEDSELDFYSYQPTNMSWTRADDRTVQCILFSYEDVTGTLQGAAY